jgi:hypothetical protein
LFKSIFILAIALLLAGAVLTPVNHCTVAQPGSASDLSALPLTFPAQSPEVIAYFNDIARPEDIVSLPKHFLSALPEIKAGQTMVSFSSWEEAEGTIPSIQTEIGWVLYNPEHWENTPAAEQKNLRFTVQNAAEFLHARGLCLFLAPDRRFIDETLEDIAPYADALLLQGQRLQGDPKLFASWMTEKIEMTRAVNPDILIYVQVGANRDTPEVVLRAIQTVSDQIDGVAIWSHPRTLENLQAFISLIRPETIDLTTEPVSLSETTLPSIPPEKLTSTASNLIPTFTRTPIPSLKEKIPPTLLPLNSPGEPTLTASGIAPTPTPMLRGQWIPAENGPPICIGFMFILLGVLIVVFVFKLTVRSNFDGI